MSPETSAERRPRAGRVARKLAAILPAQCTDKQVNEVTPALFARYPTPGALAAAPLADIDRSIHATELIPLAEWTANAHRVIHHGQVCCDARRPHCEACRLAADCPWPRAREGVRSPSASMMARRPRAAGARSPRP